MACVCVHQGPPQVIDLQFAAFRPCLLSKGFRSACTAPNCPCSPESRPPNTCNRRTGYAPSTVHRTLSTSYPAIDDPEDITILARQVQWSRHTRLPSRRGCIGCPGVTPWLSKPPKIRPESAKELWRCPDLDQKPRHRNCAAANSIDRRLRWVAIC